MRKLITYSIFETIQQAEKILSNGTDHLREWVIIKDTLIKNNLQNYLGWCAKNLEDIYWTKVDNIVDVLKWVKSNKVDYIDKHWDDIEELYYDYKHHLPFKKFINKWCPASLRKDVDIKKLSNLLVRFSDFLDKISSVQEETLKKGSRCKTAEEWVNFISSSFNKENLDIEFLKRSNVEIIAEDDTFLIFKPNDYTSYMENLITTNWCLMSYPMWLSYEKKGFYFYISYNKLDKEKSFVFTMYSNDKHSNVPIESIHDYTNRPVYNINNSLCKKITIKSKDDFLEISNNVLSRDYYYYYEKRQL